MGETLSNIIHESSVSVQKRALFVSTVPITLTSFLLPLASALKNEGYTIDCVAKGAPDYPGLEVFDKKFDNFWSRSFASSFNNIIKASCRIKSIVKKGSYDVVHVHTPIAALITRLALRRLGRFGGTAPAIIYTVHGFHFHSREKSKFKNWFFFNAERLALCWTDYLVVMNDEDEKAAPSLFAKRECPCAKICLTRKMAGEARCARKRAQIRRIDGIGFDFSSRAGLRSINRARLAESTGEVPLNLVMIAELNDNKQHLSLLDELAKLKELGQDFHIALIGSGPHEFAIREKIAALGLEEEVSLTGQLEQEEILEHLQVADIGLLVSKREGLPRSLMEIIAAGIPVMGTHIRGIADEVRNTGALVFELGAEGGFELAHKLKHYADTREELVALADEQYAYARAHFDEPLILKAYLELYAEATKERA